MAEQQAAPTTARIVYGEAEAEYRFANALTVRGGRVVYLEFWQQRPDAPEGRGIARIAVPRELADELREQLAGLPEKQ
jgi:hypothetical protein